MNRLLRSLSLAPVVMLLGASVARADESPAPPRHFASYGLDWLNYVAPEDLPATRYAVCIVDTGTAVTFDTPADDAAGPILERLSTDGGPGTPEGDASEQMHGTRMAMDAIAPANDWGTIGTATWSRLVTVRAQVNDELTLRQDAYRKGIARCQEATSRHPIAAVSLSFGCSCSFSPTEEAKIADVVSAARSAGMSVVAAAGNDGGPTESPARYDGVVAVAGGAPDGALCGYSSYDERVAVTAPACPVDDADPLTGMPAYDMGAGSSAATIITASFIAALRTLRPDASPSQVESWIDESARTSDGRRVLDGEAAARLAGLGDVVDRARARMTAAANPAAAAVATSVATTTAATPALTLQPVAIKPPSPRIQRPRRIRARWSKGELTVLTRGRPRGARLQVRAERLGEFDLVQQARTRARKSSQLRMRVRWKPDRLVVRFVPGRDLGRSASRPRILRRTRSARFV